MNKEREIQARSHAKMQKDVDALLRDVGHLFDDVAEYAIETDHELNVIDANEASKQPLVIRETKKVRYQPKPVMELPHHRHLPKNPRKVIRYMPLELQRQMRDLSALDDREMVSRKAMKILNILLKPINL